MGFIELAEKRPTAVWRSMQMAPGAPRRCWRTAFVRPLVELFAEGPHVGAVLVSADRVRLLEWSLGAIRELEDWEITLSRQDWRERKAERAIPGRGSWPRLPVTTSSASGSTRTGGASSTRSRARVARSRAKRRGSTSSSSERRTCPANSLPAWAAAQGRVHIVQHDLVSSKESQVAERVEAEVREVNTARAMELVGEIEEAIGAGPGVALGTQETLQALAEGRARHLVFNAQPGLRAHRARGASRYDGGREDLPLGERLVQLAVATDADGDAGVRGARLSLSPTKASLHSCGTDGERTNGAAATCAVDLRRTAGYLPRGPLGDR